MLGTERHRARHGEGVRVEPVERAHTHVRSRARPRIVQIAIWRREIATWRRETRDLPELAELPMAEGAGWRRASVRARVGGGVGVVARLLGERAEMWAPG